MTEQSMREMLEERYRAGYDAGQKALGGELIEQRKQLLDIQAGVLRSIEQALPGVVAECERSLVLLALEAARRVVHGIPISAETVEAVVRSALAELQDAAEYEVRLHPDDLALLEQVQSGLVPAQGSKVRFSPDHSVPRGGCMVQSKHGSIEATREKMFEKLQAAVLC